MMSRKLHKIFLISGIAAIFAAIPVFWFAYAAPDELEVDFLDVGQGDAILIRSPYGQNILIDGGPDDTVVRRLSENLPWWDRTIDLMVLTHPHDDHVNGLNEVIKRYRVGRVLYTGVAHASPGYAHWLGLIRDNRIPLVIVDRPQTVNLGAGCRFDIVYPRASLAGRTVDSLNNSSIVAKLACGGGSFLFMGDAEAETERELLAAGADLSARVLKAGHHGSDTSSGGEFLEAAGASAAVIEVGKDNGFGHPSLRIIRRLERRGMKIYRTDIDGTVRMTVSGGIIGMK